MPPKRKQICFRLFAFSDAYLLLLEGNSRAGCIRGLRERAPGLLRTTARRALN